MVARNRKFSPPQEYSRRTDRRAVDRLVAEELDGDAVERPRVEIADAMSTSRVVLQLEPSVVPRTGIDLRSVAPTALRHKPMPAAPAVEATPAGAPSLARRLASFAARQGRRLLAWISWR